MYKTRLIKVIVIIFLIIAAGLFRFYRLDKFPVQLNHDEVSQIYDLISIVKTGKDIYKTPFPLAFKSTGDYKPGHYIYVSVLPYLLLGNREEVIRIPSAFFGTITVAAIFVFTLTITNNVVIALLAGLLFAINPSDIFYARKSFENVIGVFLVFSGLACLIQTIKVRYNPILRYIGIALLILSLYVYTAYLIIIPPLLTTFVLIYKKQLLKKDLLRIIIFSSILILPFVYITFINPDLRFRANSVFITQDPALGAQLTYIENENPAIKTILATKIYIDYVFERFLNQLDPVYIFLNGLDFTNQGYLGMGPLMLVEFPLFLVGLVYLITIYRNSNHKKFVLSLLLIAFLPSALTFEQFSPHRSVIAFPVMLIIVAFGLYWVITYVTHIRSKLIKLVGSALLVSAFFFNFAYFLQMYTVNLPYEKSQHMHYPYKQVAEFAWLEHRNYQKVVIDNTYGEVWPVRAVGLQYYLAYYGNYPPIQFQDDYREEDGTISFNNFQIRHIDWGRDQNLENALLIASPWSVPRDKAGNNRIIKTFYFYDHTPAFYAIQPKENY